MLVGASRLTQLQLELMIIVGTLRTAKSAVLGQFLIGFTDYETAAGIVDKAI